ncbi:MAG: AI-2E family transporter [Thermoanaerobaculia bacterium]
MSESSPVEIRPPRFTVFATVTYGLFALLILYAAFIVVRPFLTPLLLALVIVTLTYPTYERVLNRVGGRQNVAASLMLLFIILVLVIPATLLILLLVQQASGLFERLQTTDYGNFFAIARIDEGVAVVQRLVPWVQLDQVRIEEFVLNVVRQIPAFVAMQGSRLLAGFFGVFLGFLLMLLGAFVFYTNGLLMLREVKFISPLPDVYDEKIFTKFRGVVDATFRGQLLTALAQGFVTAIGLFIAGVPGAFFWGAVASIFSLIPMVGAAAVWFPSGLYLAFLASQGQLGWWRPIFLFAWGFVAVSLVDNLVRPAVMRSGVNMHPIILFFAILGGLQAFGPTGIFLGPLVFVLLVTLIEIYKTAFAVRAEAPLIVPAGAAPETSGPVIAPEAGSAHESGP